MMSNRLPDFDFGLGETAVDLVVFEKHLVHYFLIAILLMLDLLLDLELFLVSNLFLVLIFFFFLG